MVGGGGAGLWWTVRRWHRVSLQFDGQAVRALLLLLRLGGWQLLDEVGGEVLSCFVEV